MPVGCRSPSLCAPRPLSQGSRLVDCEYRPIRALSWYPSCRGWHSSLTAASGIISALKYSAKIGSSELSPGGIAVSFGLTPLHHRICRCCASTDRRLFGPRIHGRSVSRASHYLSPFCRSPTFLTPTPYFQGSWPCKVRSSAGSGEGRGRTSLIRSTSSSTLWKLRIWRIAFGKALGKKNSFAHLIHR